MTGPGKRSRSNSKVEKKPWDHDPEKEAREVISQMMENRDPAPPPKLPEETYAYLCGAS